MAVLDVTQLKDHQVNTLVSPTDEFHLFWWKKGLTGDEYIKYDLYFDGMLIDNSTLKIDEINTFVKDTHRKIYNGYYNVDIMMSQIEFLQETIDTLINDKSVNEISEFSGVEADTVVNIKKMLKRIELSN